MLRSAEAALAMAPEEPSLVADLGEQLAYGGHVRKALALIAKAEAHDARSWMLPWGRMWASLLGGEPALTLEAAATFDKPQIAAVAALVRLERIDEARALADRLKAVFGPWTLTRERAAYPMPPEIMEPYIEDLRKAGFPE